MQDARHGRRAGKASLGLFCLSANLPHCGGRTCTRPHARRRVGVDNTHHGRHPSLIPLHFLSSIHRPQDCDCQFLPVRSLARLRLNHGFRHPLARRHGRRLLVWRHRCSLCTCCHHRSRRMCSCRESGYFRVGSRASITHDSS